MEHDEETELKGKETPEFVVETTHEAKLKELLRNLASIELKLCSDASKEFIKLLKSDRGGELLREYVLTSSQFSELLQAWNFRQEKPGLCYILSLTSGILGHPAGIYKRDDMGRIVVSRALDKFARLIFEHRMGDVYKELNSKEGKRQNAALLLLASIVKRGSGLASDVANNFDFKNPVFPKLAEYTNRKGSEGKRKKSHSTRKAFVRFAMSFLEVGDPRLLRWVLQQKEMFSGVLRGLGSDEEETAAYVLTTLRDKVLTQESLVPPGLRSVLFGSVTLEQLINISGRDDGGIATEMAAKVLYMVCTDPSNGLMPNMERLPNPLRGNPTRILGVMKKLKATEIDFHRDLLLAIVKGRPLFGSAYMDEFPHNLDDHASPTWVAAVSLAANLISSVNAGLPFSFLDSQLQEPPSFNSPEVQSIIKCICPRPFTRLVINKGLLHPDSLVKHGTLRLVLEALRLLDNFFLALNDNTNSSSQIVHRRASLKQEIQNEVRLLLPDHQVLLSLLSSLNVRHKIGERGLKRAADTEIVPAHSRSPRKKLKSCSSNRETETDILVGGISSSSDIVLQGDNESSQGAHNSNELENLDGQASLIAEIWELRHCNNANSVPEDEEIYLYSKLLDTIKLYHHIMPSVLEGSFDFFKVLPSNASSLPVILQQSLLSLLVEHIGWSSGCEIPSKLHPLMYKHLLSFINMLIYSPVREIKDQAYILAQAAMFSTGAFDCSVREIDAWFLFLPGYCRERTSFEDKEIEAIQYLSATVISFFCDAVSTIGNNLFKYMNILRLHIYHLKGVKDISPRFSPLLICVVEKCLRLLGSESGTFSLPEKSMISMYVSNTLKYLLQTQVEAGLLSSLICLLMSERLEDVDVPEDFCEWRPLKNLLIFSRSILNQQTCRVTTIDGHLGHKDNSFVNILAEAKEVGRRGNDCPLVGITTAFSFSMLCATPGLILQHFPVVMSISQDLLGVPFFVLSSMFFLEQSFFHAVCKLWPEISFSALGRVVSVIHSQNQSEEMIGDSDLEILGSESVAFYSFLKRLPFYVLFPAIMSFESPYLLKFSKLQELLLAKLSDGMAYHFISYFRLVLFWFHHVQSSYRLNPVDEHEHLSELCFTLIRSMLAQLLVKKRDSGGSTISQATMSNRCAEELAEIIFSHPAVAASLNCPLPGSKKLPDDIFGKATENFLGLARKGVHKMDYHVFKVLETVLEQLFTFSHGQQFSTEVGCSNRRATKAFESFVQNFLLILKVKFDQSTEAKYLVPSLFALHALFPFISPMQLLELVHWIFSRVDLSESTFLDASKISVLSVGLNIASRAFDFLSCYMPQIYIKEVPFHSSGTQDSKFDFALLEKIYFHVMKIALHFDLANADLCLLKAIKVTNAEKYLQTEHLTKCMVMSRVITSTPVKMLSRCIHRTNMTNAQLLFHLTELSSLHLSIFGHLFLEMVNNSRICKSDMIKCVTAHSDDDMVMLLPTAISYLQSTVVKYGYDCYKHLRSIPSMYWKILFNGFSDWKGYVSRDIFQVELGESLPLTLDELLNGIQNSLLGRAIFIMRHYLAFNRVSVKLKKQLKLFDSVCPSGTDSLLECDVSEIDSCSLNQSYNHVIKAVTKIYLCKMLLFPEEHQIKVLQEKEDGDKTMKDFTSEEASSKEHLLRVRFLKALVYTWQLIVKNVSSNTVVSSEIRLTKYLLFRHLEVFILRMIVQLETEMHNNTSMQFYSFPYPEELARSCLLHRFEDASTLSMLRVFLTLVPEGESLHVLVLQLLLAHSQFAPTVQSLSNSSSCLQFGTIFRPMSSILRSLNFSSMDLNAFVGGSSLQASKLTTNKLEIIKLLRVLVHYSTSLVNTGSEQDIGINFKELLFLLLSSYGATLSEIDLEIYNLLHELEGTEVLNSGSIAEMDYLWGNAVVVFRKEQEKEQVLSSDRIDDTEAVELHRRSQFRENVPIDPQKCAATVLNFPYHRTTSARASSFSKLSQDNARHVPEAESGNMEKIQIYDPAFILRFSIHTLSMGYIEPVEFASLGLLAVAFVSLSSPDDEMRKLGYKVLGRFKNTLEISQKRKEVSRLRLLLTYVQNGIEEPWQRIPSIYGVFIAEASFVLLDPSHDHYSSISKLLGRSPKMNMKSIPLFNEYFWSSSVTFKADRLWMLRLLCAGLNLDEDAQIYTRNSILVTLLSFYASSLSDDESRELIIQVVKKSFKLYKTSRYLLEDCGVLSWLSSLISSFCERKCQDQRASSLTLLAEILEVVKDIIRPRQTVEWLQQHALEQLTQLSCQLHILLGTRFIKEKVPLVNSILEILASTLKISQKRKVFQPHFTLSIEALFLLYENIDACYNEKYSHNAEDGVKVVLMSTPQATIFTMDHEKLQKFILWATSTTLRSNSVKSLRAEESNFYMKPLSEKEQMEDSLVSKLLRWFTAAVILRQLSKHSDYAEFDYSLQRSSRDTVLSLIKGNERVQRGNQAVFGCSEELLAATIFYLQELLGRKCNVLPSVVTALCLLLFSGSSLPGLDAMLDEGSSVASFLSRIRCPAEANPSWRWSFYQPWKDLESDLSEAEKMDEVHACQSVLVVISNVLGKRSSSLSPSLSHVEVENSGVFEWERSLLRG